MPPRLATSFQIVPGAPGHHRWGWMMDGQRGTVMPARPSGPVRARLVGQTGASPHTPQATPMRGRDAEREEPRSLLHLPPQPNRPRLAVGVLPHPHPPRPTKSSQRFCPRTLPTLRLPSSEAPRLSLSAPRCLLTDPSASRLSPDSAQPGSVHSSHFIFF